MKPLISVVIPAYNEEKTIGRTLQSLVIQKTNQKFEVIVVDNASTDKTPEIVQKYKDKLNLTLIQEKRKGRGQARFTGFRTAKGDILLSTDADTILPLDWIDKMTTPFKNPKIAAVTGGCRIEDCSMRINKTFNIFQPLSMFTYRLFFRHFWLSGFNFAIRADIYKISGEFDPKSLSNEDTELSFRVAKRGKIKFVHQPVTVSGRRVKNGFARGMMPYMTGYIQQFTFKKPADLSDIR